MPDAKRVKEGRKINGNKINKPPEPAEKVNKKEGKDSDKEEDNGERNERKIPKWN